jgi:hypothetical protein
MVKRVKVIKFFVVVYAAIGIGYKFKAVIALRLDVSTLR